MNKNKELREGSDLGKGVDTGKREWVQCFRYWVEVWVEPGKEAQHVCGNVKLSLGGPPPWRLLLELKEWKRFPKNKPYRAEEEGWEIDLSECPCAQYIVTQDFFVTRSYLALSCLFHCSCWDNFSGCEFSLFHLDLKLKAGNYIQSLPILPFRKHQIK